LVDGELFTTARDGVSLNVRLTPKASANRIGPVVSDDAGGAILKVAVTEIPEGGKANKALIKLLAKSWRLPKTAISVKRGIKKGHKDRRKTIFIENQAIPDGPDSLLKKLKEDL
jgi:hypothetical protein